ncbi:MAG: hypothetical protein WKF46_01710 [Candidatus Limnocylindrales bacterium]
MDEQRKPTDQTSRGGHPIADSREPTDFGAQAASSAEVERFELLTLRAEQMVAGRPYLEFLRRERLSAGLYVLEAGADDPQQPHAEEIYHVLDGRPGGGDRATARKAGKRRVRGAGLEHRFHSVSSRLAVLVVFAPPEGSVEH